MASSRLPRRLGKNVFLLGSTTAGCSISLATTGRNFEKAGAPVHRAVCIHAEVRNMSRLCSGRSGRCINIPGLMVVAQKPTPMIGLELNTLYCRLSGNLVWFEVYERKKAIMALKIFNGEYPKLIALTLRMCKPYFRTESLGLLCLSARGRVLIADSRFGLVVCAQALFKNGRFAIMNIKMAHRDYSKYALLAEVGEIKGGTAEARDAPPQ
eukprot:6187215-Pleurochrysis_carterae.AAC.2